MPTGFVLMPEVCCRVAGCFISREQYNANLFWISLPKPVTGPRPRKSPMQEVERGRRRGLPEALVGSESTAGFVLKAEMRSDLGNDEQ